METAQGYRILGLGILRDPWSGERDLCRAICTTKSTLLLREFNLAVTGNRGRIVAQSHCRPSRFRLVGCPGRTHENSPALECWAVRGWRRQSQPGRQKGTCGSVAPPGLTPVPPSAQCSSTGLFSVVPAGRIPERKPPWHESEMRPGSALHSIPRASPCSIRREPDLI